MSIKKTSFPFYRIKEGENLKILAQKFDVDSTKILIDNRLAPKQLKAGMFIKIEK